jgi:NTE family protein
LFDLATRLFSPYEFNPFNLNPLKDALEVSVDFEALRRSACPLKLFLRDQRAHRKGQGV